MKKTLRGFTLVELLVVIGILAVLTAIVLVAVNPGRQFMQARDTQRRADVNTISTAIVAFMSDPNNTADKSLSGMGITADCVIGPAHAIGTAGLDLGAIVAPVYVAALPVDPTNGDATNTLYTVCVNDATSNRFTVAATSEMVPATPISVTR